MQMFHRQLCRSRAREHQHDHSAGFLRSQSQVDLPTHQGVEAEAPSSAQVSADVLEALHILMLAGIKPH